MVLVPRTDLEVSDEALEVLVRERLSGFAPELEVEHIAIVE